MWGHPLARLASPSSVILWQYRRFSFLRLRHRAARVIRLVFVSCQQPPRSKTSTQGHATAKRDSPVSLTSCFALTHRHHFCTIVPFSAIVKMADCESVTRLVSFGAQSYGYGVASTLCHSRDTSASLFSCGILAMYPLDILGPCGIAVASRIWRNGPIGKLQSVDGARGTLSVLRRFLSGSILCRFEQMHCPMHL